MTTQTEPLSAEDITNVEEVLVSQEQHGRTLTLVPTDVLRRLLDAARAEATPSLSRSAVVQEARNHRTLLRWSRAAIEDIDEYLAALRASWKKADPQPDLTPYQRGYIDGFDAPRNLAARAEATPTLSRDDENPWLARLVKAERENHCGDATCMTRRVSAAIRVLTGGKEHQDYCWPVEMFEVEMGVRDPETVGAEPNVEPGAAIRRLLRAVDAILTPDPEADPVPEDEWDPAFIELREARAALASEKGS